MDAEKTVRGPKPDGPARKLFTVEQANRAVPLVRRVVGDIVEEYRALMDWETKYQESQAQGPGEVDLADASRRERDRSVDRLGELTDELSEIGVELKDWEQGLVDFACAYEGRVVYLCWKLGEERVAHWHEIHAGFAGRRPIDDEFKSAVDRE